VVADAAERAAVDRVFDEAGRVGPLVMCVSGGLGAARLVDLDLGALRRVFEAKTLAFAVTLSKLVARQHGEAR
jgi:hypothetical protein